MKVYLTCLKCNFSLIQSNLFILTPGHLAHKVLVDGKSTFVLHEFVPNKLNNPN